MTSAWIPSGLDRLGGLHDAGDHRAVGEHGDVASLAERRGLSERDPVVAVGDLTRDGPVDPLRLEEDHRVRVEDRGEEQSLGVGRVRRG